MTVDQEKITLPSAIVVRDLAEILDTSPVEVVKALMQNGVMATVVQVIDFDTAAIIAADFGFDVDAEGAALVDAPETEESTSVRLVDDGEDAVVRRRRPGTRRPRIGSLPRFLLLPVPWWTWRDLPLARPLLLSLIHISQPPTPW